MKTMQRFVYAPDPHGEHVNEKTWKVFLEFCGDFKPHKRIFGGDVWDFSPFRAGASEAEREQSLEADLSAGLRLISEFRPTDHCLGNHDLRPWVVMKSGKTAALRDYAAQIVAQIVSLQSKLKIKSYGYKVNAFCPIGPRLKAIHGFSGGKYGAARQAEAFGCVIGGHSHKIDYHRTASIDVRECWLAGCMRQPFAEFNERNIATLSHAQGFVFGYYDPHGVGFTVYQAREQEDGRWAINGKLY